MEHKVYWFITVFETAEIDNLGWPKTGDTRCWGFYTDKEEALNILHNNITDLWEGCYNYAVLEPYHEGICGIGPKCDRQFFEYNKEANVYSEIDEPDGFNHVVGFGIG